VGPARAARMIDAADSLVPLLSRYAFKIVVVLRRA
jgi:hypothetical protein